MLTKILTIVFNYLLIHNDTYQYKYNIVYKY